MPEASAARCNIDIDPQKLLGQQACTVETRASSGKSQYLRQKQQHISKAFTLGTTHIYYITDHTLDICYQQALLLQLN